LIRNKEIGKDGSMVGWGELNSYRATERLKVAYMYVNRYCVWICVNVCMYVCMNGWDGYKDGKSSTVTGQDGVGGGCFADKMRNGRDLVPFGFNCVSPKK
jgi:hypothetical protein